MIKKVTEVLKPIFEELNYINYLKVSYSDKADFQINSVFQIAKEKNSSPIEIGESLVNKINEKEYIKEYFKSIEFIKPGFININLSDKFINDNINDLIKNGIKSKEKKEEVYFLDYGGPNIAKPLHIGHLRPAIIGESLKRILEFAGYKTISDVHLGDYGLQIGQVIYGVLKDNKTLEEIDIDYLNETYPKISVLCKEDENIYEKCKKITYDFQHGSYREIYDKIKGISLNDIKRIYNYLGVSFDMWLGEYDAEPFIPEFINLLENKNLIKEDEGAKIVEIKTENDNKEMPPVIVSKSDGSVMYATTDLACIYERVKKYNPDYILYVVDARQSLHFEQIFRVALLAGLTNKVKLEHIPFGTINGSDGKPFKTRSGETLKLDELIEMVKTSFINLREQNKNMKESDIDIIVNAIIKYADLQNNREKNYSFDIKKFSDVNGKTGPYILYSALRIRKLINENSVIENEVGNVIYNEIDRNLRMKILELNKYIEKSITDRMPSYIGEYLYDLANIVNSFYQNININSITDTKIKSDYLNVLKLTLEVIMSCLNMLIIDLPSEM